MCYSHGCMYRYQLLAICFCIGNEELDMEFLWISDISLKLTRKVNMRHHRSQSTWNSQVVPATGLSRPSSSSHRCSDASSYCSVNLWVTKQPAVGICPLNNQQSLQYQHHKRPSQICNCPESIKAKLHPGSYLMSRFLSGPTNL